VTQFHLSTAQSGCLIEARVGDELVLQLPENPTTGYRWQPESGLQVSAREDRFEPAAEAPGAGGVRTLRFFLSIPGSSDLSFSLRRPWEVEGQFLERVVYHLLIRNEP
jgi:inhibitor of cysteine peptidase